MSKNSIRTIAAILAGGTGSRLGAGLPKQFIEVGGRTIIEHTIDRFEDHPMIDSIVVVMHASYIGQMEALVAKNGWEKVQTVLPGGSERYDSSLAAIRTFSDHPDWNLLIHDAARPMVSARIITEVIMALDKYRAVDVAMPATDTIIEIDESGTLLKSIPDRNRLRQVQTPQGFKVGLIQKAYETGMSRADFTATDDCGTVARYLPSEPIFVVAGEPTNLKVTYQNDLILLEGLLSK